MSFKFPAIVISLIGYLIFEIPQGMPITTLWWEEVDSIVALLYLKPDPVE